MIFLFEARIVFRQNQNAGGGAVKVSQNGLACAQGCAEVFVRAFELRQTEEGIAISGICAQNRTEFLPCLPGFSSQFVDLAQAKVGIDQTRVQAQGRAKTLRGIRVPLLSRENHPQSGPTARPGGGVTKRQSRFLFGANQIARAHHFEGLFNMIGSRLRRARGR